jgi:hypothetical protein
LVNGDPVERRTQGEREGCVYSSLYPFGFTHGHHPYDYAA